MKANVYVNGFNLYYGIRQHARRGMSVKWLDLAALCQRLLSGDTINRIRYFTALVTARLPLMETVVVTHDLSADDESIRTEAVIA